MSTTTVRGNAPRPTSGEGDVVMTLADNDLILSWKNGELADARFASDHSMLEEGGSTDATTCECCVWKNGVEHCKSIRCGSSCP